MILLIFTDNIFVFKNFKMINNTLTLRFVYNDYLGFEYESFWA